MNTRMLRSSLVAGAMAAITLGLGACKLDVPNPNDPDRVRALSDPAGLEQLLSGAFQTWVSTRGDYYSALPMTAIADNYTASWNNAAIRFYNSVGSDCPSRCGWTNSATAPEAAGGPTVESSWYGYYNVLSSANSVMAAIDQDGVCFDDDCATDNTLTSRDRALAKMLQGMALAGIALIYDQGFVVDENSDLSAILTTPFTARDLVRDAALTKFDEAFTEAGLKTWSTKTEWMGVGAGRTYTNTQIRQLIRTMQAELIAMFPRDPTEIAAANWANVATYAAAGVSSGTAFDWEYYIDAGNSQCGLDCVKTWGNSIGTMRVDTRVATKLATNHQHPWPEPGGNPCPTVSADRRVGDGSYGPSDDFNGYSTKAATANAGTDFACSGVAIFPAARGQYHQSNLQHIRYQYLAYEGENLPGFNGVGQDPFYTRAMNDLLWAEGEMRRAAGNLVTAASKINNTRVTRGNLTPATAADVDLFTKLYYEQDIEFMGQGPDPFFNRRRRAADCAQPCIGVEGLVNGTPKHMPVPDKELQVLTRANYTFGGPTAPAKLEGGRLSRPTVRDRWEEIQRMKRIELADRRR